MSRQAVNRYVKRLIEEGRVAKSGSTRGAGYAPATGSQQPSAPSRRFRKVYPTKSLEEDRVFREVALFLAFDGNLSRAAGPVYQYALTEMVNNAIDHSGAPTCTVTAEVDSYWATFTVADSGVGIFASIASKFHLNDEVDSVLELSKGKRTSKPERHTGEGIFFTSRCADRLEIRSHRIRLVYDNEKRDVFVEKVVNRAGTAVEFRLRRRSRRSLQSVFEAYAPESFDYRFERTRVGVRLIEERYASRSEAKRLLAGLEKFREIILDFKGVAGIGQGFADEIFRVFASAHPDIAVLVENANSVVERMIAQARP